MSRLGVPRGRGRGRSRSWRGRGGMRGGRPGGGRGGMIDNREMINTYQFQPGVLGHGRGMARGQGGPGRGRGRDFSVFRGIINLYGFNDAFSYTPNYDYFMLFSE